MRRPWTHSAGAALAAVLSALALLACGDPDIAQGPSAPDATRNHREPPLLGEHQGCSQDAQSGPSPRSESPPRDTRSESPDAEGFDPGITLTILGGVPPVHRVNDRERIRVEVWSDAERLATADLLRRGLRPLPGFRVHADADDPTVWRLENVPPSTQILTLHRTRAGRVIALARPIRLSRGAEQPLPVTWTTEADMGHVQCTANFGGSKQLGSRYLLRWDGLPMPEQGSLIAVPARAEIEIECTGWRRAIDFGLPPSARLRLEAGETAAHEFELPSGRVVMINAVRRDGRRTPAMVRLWRRSRGGRYEPWWPSKDDEAMYSRVHVQPGHYGVLVQARDGGSGWATFHAASDARLLESLEVEVEEQGPRVRIVFTGEAEHIDEIDRAWLDRADAGSPRESAFWEGSVRRGEITTGAVPPGTYNLLVRAGLWLWTCRLQVTGTGSMEVRLPAPKAPPRALTRTNLHSQAVHCVLPAHHRPSGFWVIARRTDLQETWHRVDYASRNTALFNGLATGRYRISIRPSWNLPFATIGASTDVTIDGKSPPKKITLTPPSKPQSR